MNRIALFASGAGSNAARIISHFKTHESIRVALIVCNNPRAGVRDVADREKVPLLMISREDFFTGPSCLLKLREHQINFIVLAGFLWKMPPSIIDAYPSSIINIHPALLPSYGGKGMYGMNVHAAVLAAGEKESGITIHFVDEHYDNGDIIFQATCAVSETDTPETLAKKIHSLEYEHFPKVIEQVILLQNQR